MWIKWCGKLPDILEQWLDARSKSCEESCEEKPKKRIEIFFPLYSLIFNYIERLLLGRLALMAEASNAESLADEFARSLASCSVALICLWLFSI